MARPEMRTWVFGPFSALSAEIKFLAPSSMGQHHSDRFIGHEGRWIQWISRNLRVGSCFITEESLETGGLWGG